MSVGRSTNIFRARGLHAPAIDHFVHRPALASLLMDSRESPPRLPTHSQPSSSSSPPIDAGRLSLGDALGFPLPPSPLLIEPKIEHFEGDLDVLLASSSSSRPSPTPLPSGMPAGGDQGAEAIPRPMESLQEAPIPPFLSKTYDLVEEAALDPVISWGPAGASFVVWDPVKFACSVLPRHFKHNNFSSFVRQLNTYGFHKINTDRWEFANEDFLRGNKSLLRNIHRRRLSQVQQVATQIGSPLEAGKSGLEAELHKLRGEKKLLMQEVVKLQQEHLATVQHMDALNQRMQSAEVRQKQMVTFLAKVLQNPVFLSHLRQQKEQREIASTRARRKFLKHQQPGQTESNKFVEQQIVNCQPGFSDGASSSVLQCIESDVDEQLQDNILQDMVGKLGLDRNGQELIGATDKVVEKLGTSPLNSGLPAFRKNVVDTRTDDIFDGAEYFISFPEDVTPVEEFLDIEIPESESLSRPDSRTVTFEEADVMNFKIDIPASDSEHFMSFPKYLSGEQVFPDATSPASKSIIKEEDAWDVGFEVGGSSFRPANHMWDTLVRYNIQDLEAGAGWHALGDVGTSAAEESLEIEKRTAGDSSFQEHGNQPGTLNEDPKDMEP